MNSEYKNFILILYIGMFFIYITHPNPKIVYKI